MSSKKQDKTVVELMARDGTPRDFAKDYPRIVEMSGYVADAFLRLWDADKFGVHKSMIKKDAYARFDQLGIKYRFFNDPNRGDKGGAQNWVRLPYRSMLEMRVLDREAA